MKKALFFLLPLLCCQTRVNLLTSVVVSQLPSTFTLSCVDCTEPIVYEPTGFPDFASIEDDQLRIEGSPEPGQYHLEIEMKDADGKEAHLLLILVILDETA